MVVVSPPSNYICDSSPLEVAIYNNLNGDYRVASDLNNIDLGAFVVLKWKDYSIMLPRTFNAGEVSFSDGRWHWSYTDHENHIDVENPKFMHVLQKGQMQEYECEYSIDRT